MSSKTVSGIILKLYVLKIYFLQDMPRSVFARVSSGPGRCSLPLAWTLAGALALAVVLDLGAKKANVQLRQSPSHSQPSFGGGEGREVTQNA